MTNTEYMAPPNSSVEKNMEQANQYANSHTKAESYLWFYWMVKNNKSKENSNSWDYKQQGSSYAPFGNFNYGATGAAMGIPNDILLRLAGMAQWMAGTSKDEWGNPIWSEPYGDDPADQAAILDGISYAETYGYTSKNMDIDADTLTRIAATLALSKYIKTTPESLFDLYNQVYNSSYFSVYGNLYSQCALENDLKFISTAYQCDLDKSATYRIVRYDPLTLDLDGDGIETIAASNHSGVMFDSNNDGIKTASGWISSDDGILVRDINKNGVIDDGSELFGDSTKLSTGANANNGFAALTDLDSNKDGKIDKNDTAYTELKVWRDLNQDGISSENELFTLSELNIQSLNTSQTASSTLLAGNNLLTEIGSYTKTDGTTQTMGDVNLVEDNLFTEYKNKIAVSEEIAELPNLNSYGRLRGLQEAAMQSTALADVLKKYAAATTKDQQMGLIDDLVLEWAKTDPMWSKYLTLNLWGEEDPNSKNIIHLRPSESIGFMIEKEEFIEPIHIVDAFFNKITKLIYKTAPNSTLTPIQIAERDLKRIQTSIYDALLFQTRLKPYLDNIEFIFNETGIHISYDKMNAMLLANSSGEKLKSGLDDLNDLQRVTGNSFDNWNSIGLIIDIGRNANFSEQFKSYYHNIWGGSFITGSGALAGSSMDDIILGDDTDNTLTANAGNDFVQAGNGNDAVTGGDGNDILYGQDGNDTLRGGNGNDILEGGAGNDTLSGEAGNDTYLFGKGDGQDVISSDYDTAATKLNVLQFKAGVAASEVIATRAGNDLVLSIAGTADQITIGYFFYSDNPANTYNAIQQVRFADDTVWDVATLVTKSQLATEGDDTLTGTVSNETLRGGLGNDKLSGRAGDDVLYGDEGNDTLSGDEGHDVLFGGDGNDILRGGNGNDILEGGAGNDTLSGEAGNDTYLFGKDNGQDIISEYDSTSGNTDILKLQDVASDQLWLTKSGNNLDISVIGTTDKVTIQNWYSGNAYHVEQFKTADGKTLLDSQVVNLVSAMASMTPPAAGQTTLPQNYQEQLSTVLAANWK